MKCSICSRVVPSRHLKDNHFTGHAGVYAPGDDNNVPLVFNLNKATGEVQGNTFDHVDIGVLVADAAGPLDITGNTFENMHRVGPNTAGGFAAGVVFFSPDPFNGLINVSNNTFTNDDAGIRTSAVPGTTVAGSSITIDGNHFTTVTNVGFQPVGGVLHFTNSTVNGPSVPSEFFGGSTDDTITSTTVNDIVHGNSGIDTVVFSDTFAHANASSWNGTTAAVTTPLDGTDTLDSVEKVVFAGGQTVWLVGQGTGHNLTQFSQLFDGNAANGEAADGDIIIAAPGTYNTFTVTKDVTILGANEGIAGADTRGPETIIDGGIYVHAAGATLDGIKVVHGTMLAGNPAGIYVDVDNVTITNSVLVGDGTAGMAGVLTPGGVDGLTLSDSSLTGWYYGTYFNPTTEFEATGNLFKDTALIGDDFADTSVIASNTFDGVDAGIGYGVLDTTDDLGAVANATNTYINGSGNGIYLYGDGDAGGQTMSGTVFDDYFTDQYKYVPGSGDDDIVYGGAGNDTFEMTAGNDTVVGGAGIDTIKGGAGIDTATYSGNAADYTVTVSGTSITVTDNRGSSPDGTDTVSTVEELKFADDTVLYVDGASGTGHYDGAFSTIGAALTAANAIGSGHVTIKVAAGTYNENVNVTRDNVSIVGSGDSTVIHGTFKSGNGIADGGVAAFLKSGAGYSQAAGAGILLNADHDSVSSLKIDGFTYGLNFGDGVDFASVSNVSFTGNLVGIKKGTTADISHFSLTSSSITDGLMGIDFDKTTTLGAQADGVADFVTINGVNFSQLVYKGAYFEALSHAHLTNINMTDVAQFGAPSSSGVAGSGGNGIDLNLKNGSYSNIEIDHFDLTNTGASDRDGLDASGHQNGGAIVVEARDFGSYLNVPGIVTDTVSIHDGTIDGHTSTGIQVGEPGQANLDGPAVNIGAVSITGAQHDSLHGDIANVTAATTTVHMLDGGDSMVASTTTTGAMSVFGGTGADTITTGGGNDTIDGGLGSDTINAGSGSDTVIGTADGVNDSYNGGSGTDTLDYSALTLAQPIGVNLGTGVASGASIGADSLTSFENLTGGAGDDSLFGSNANNVIHGGDGADNIVGNVGSDTLFGDGGNDTLNGGVNDFGMSPAAANDFLTGGAGNDTFRFEGRFGDDKIIDWQDDLTGPGTNGEDIVLAEYSGHTPLIADDGFGNAIITIDDGSVASSVTVQNTLASQLHVLLSGSDIIIH